MNTAINGDTFKKREYYKYNYTLQWDWIKSDDYDTLEALCNAISTKTFIYDRYPQSASPGIEVLASLSKRNLKSYYGSTGYYSAVVLTLTEINAR